MASRNRHSKKSTGARNLIIGAAGLVVLGLVVTKGRSPRAEEAPQTQNAEPQMMAALPLDSAVMERRSPMEKQAALDKARALGALNSYLGVSILHLDAKDERLQIPIHFKPEKLWCRGGDIDTMKFASGDLSAKNILITLEPLGDGNGDSLRTNVLKFYEEFEQNFQIKESDTSQGLGLYICSDSKNQRSCKRKTVRSHGVMGNELAAAGSQAGGKEDYLFYFQPITISKKNLETYRIDDFSAEFQSSISSYLKKQKGLNEANVQTAWNISRVMRSIPAEIQNNHMVLTLTHNDPQCLGAGPQEKKKR